MDISSKVKIKMIHDTISKIRNNVDFTKSIDEYSLDTEVDKYIDSIIDFVYDYIDLKDQMSLLEPDKSRLTLMANKSLKDDIFFISPTDLILKCQLHGYDSYATAMIVYVYAIASFCNIIANSDLKGSDSPTSVNTAYILVSSPEWRNDLFFDKTEEVLKKLNYTGPIKRTKLIDDDLLKKINKVIYDKYLEKLAKLYSKPMDDETKKCIETLLEIKL